MIKMPLKILLKHHQNKPTSKMQLLNILNLILLLVTCFYFLPVVHLDDGDPLIHKYEFGDNTTVAFEESTPPHSSPTPQNDYIDYFDSFASNESVASSGAATNFPELNFNFSNLTDTWEFDSSLYENSSGLPFVLRAVATIACVIILVFGVTGNILVPLVVCRTKELCTNSTNVFLINLSIADLLVLIFCMPSVLIELHSKPEVWTLGEVMCKSVPFLELVVAHGSILTILAISFERYYAICKPLKASYKCTIRRAVISIVCLWSIAFLATTPVLFITEHDIAEHNDGTLVNVCLTKADDTWQNYYFFGSMIIFFWVPFIVLIVVYSIIARRLVMDDRRLLIASTHSSITSGGEASLANIRSSLACVSTTSGGSISKDSSVWPVILWRHGSGGGTAGSRNGSASGPSSASRLNMTAEKAQMRSRRQVVFMLAAVVVCFFTCLLPFRLLTLWTLLVPYDDMKNLISMERYYTLLYFCRIMLYVNSMINPFLYALVSSKFRTAFVETVCQYCCYCNDYFCCYESDDLMDEFQKGMAPRGKMRRVYRRNRRFLKRQSTFNTTTTTSSSSLKNNSIQSHSHNGIVTKNPQSTRFSSMDSILTQNNLHSKPPYRPYQKQHSFDLNITSRSNGTTRRTPLSSKQSSIDSSSRPSVSLNGEQTLVTVDVCNPPPSPPPLPPEASLEQNQIIAQIAEKLNVLSTYSAEYRRANMMKRTQRVAIIDESEVENSGAISEISRDFIFPQAQPDDQQEPTVVDPNQVVPNIEEILSDPQFSIESYV